MLPLLLLLVGLEQPLERAAGSLQHRDALGLGRRSCKALEVDEARPGVFRQELKECTERFSQDMECNGNRLYLTRVDRGRDAWDVLLRANSPEQAATDPITAMDGFKAQQQSHNGAFLCDSSGKLVMYGGRIKPAGTYGASRPDHYPGLLRRTGKVSGGRVRWSEAEVLLDEKKARALNCTDNRPAAQGLCEFDGKLSAVEYRGRTFLFARANLGDHEFRHVQMSSAPAAAPSELSTFQSLIFDDYEITMHNNIYFMDVQSMGHDDMLVGLFPAVIGGEGGIYLSHSLDGLHWSKPRRIMASPPVGPRTQDYPVDGFKVNGERLAFSVDHGINLEHDDKCKAPPHTCDYEISGASLQALLGT